MQKMTYKPDSSGSVATSSACLLSTATKKINVESYTQNVNKFAFIPHQQINWTSIKEKGRLEL